MPALRVLLISKNVPWPGNSGEKMRTLGIVRALTALGDVTVLAFASEHDDTSVAEAEGVRVVSVPQPNPDAPRLLFRALAKRSITAARWWNAELKELLRAEVAQGVDIVVVEHVQLAIYLDGLDLPPHVITVLDTHNVESQLTSRLGRSTRSWRRFVYLLEAVALRRLERRAARTFDVVCVASAVDAETMRELTGREGLLVVPNAIASRSRSAAPTTNPAVCFVGLMSWAPNADAAIHFVRTTWPAVEASVPEAHLFIVGRNPTSAVMALAGPSVTVTGTVESVGPFYERSMLSVAPLLAGGGSRLKILESLTFERPVVATSVGAEGLEDLIGAGVLVADDNRLMSRTIADLLADPARCHELGRAGADAVRSRHSWSQATDSLVQLLRGSHDQRSR